MATDVFPAAAPVMPPPFEPGYTQPWVPETPTPEWEIVAELKKIGVLDGLTDDEYLWLARHGRERRGEVGAMIFREGEPAECLNFILKGEIHVRRRKAGPMALFIGRAGQMTGKLPFSRMKGYGGDGYTIGPTWVLDIHESLFPQMLEAIPSMGQRSVTALLDRVREVTRLEQQAEKLDALGKLAANLAHELNNPASAAQRSAATLFHELRTYGDRKYTLGTLCLGGAVATRLHQWIVNTRSEMADYRAAHAEQPAGSMAEMDRETAILTWLNEHKVPEAWAIAPTLAEARLPMRYLDELAANFPDEVLAPAAATFASALRVERITETIISSTVRIFDLISAIKDYSYMDQAPIQEVHLAQSLENTLTMFGSRFNGIRVVTQFDPEVTTISAYGRELNQVWTVLIENAIDAMPQGGTLTLKTRRAGEMALVEVWDTGCGIPPELATRVFEPFFTTKAPGKGLGLGLDTAQRIVHKHSGFLTLDSRPGETCLQVRLPLDPAEAY